MGIVAEVGPAKGGDLELCRFPRIVAGSRPLNGPVGNFVGGVIARSRKREGGLQQDVRLMPVDIVNHVNAIQISVESNVLNELGMLPGACDANYRPQRAMFD